MSGALKNASDTTLFKYKHNNDVVQSGDVHLRPYSEYTSAGIPPVPDQKGVNQMQLHFFHNGGGELAKAVQQLQQELQLQRGVQEQQTEQLQKIMDALNEQGQHNDNWGQCLTNFNEILQQNRDQTEEVLQHQNQIIQKQQEQIDELQDTV